MFIFAAYMLVSTLVEYGEGDRIYDDLQQYISTPAPTITVVPSNTSAASAAISAEPSPTDPGYPVLSIDFDALRAVNEDICGWLLLPDTVISYPVVYGSNNSYYLNHTATLERHKNGALFFDARNSAGDKNFIIYGHHMKNGSMFGSLVEYKDQAYYDAHPWLTLYTPDAIYRLDIFSAYVTSDDGDYVRRSWKTEDAYASFLQKITEKSLVQTDVSVTGQDSIITLSTCTYEFTNARFAVHCKVTQVA